MEEGDESGKGVREIPEEKENWYETLEATGEKKNSSFSVDFLLTSQRLERNFSL